MAVPVQLGELAGMQITRDGQSYVATGTALQSSSIIS